MTTYRRLKLVGNGVVKSSGFLAELATVATFVLGCVVYFRTVVPVFQKEKLEEDIVQKGKELEALRGDTDRAIASYVKFALIAHAVGDVQRRANAGWTMAPFHRDIDGHEPAEIEAPDSLQWKMGNDQIDPIKLMATAGAELSAPTSVENPALQQKFHDAVVSALTQFKDAYNKAHAGDLDLSLWISQFREDLKFVRRRCEVGAAQRRLSPASTKYCVDRGSLYVRSAYDTRWYSLRDRAVMLVQDPTVKWVAPASPPDPQVDRVDLDAEPDNWFGIPHRR